MADAISIQELIDARTDAKTLEEAVNGDAVTTVLSRLGETYPTLSNALNQIDSKLDSADAQIKLGITNLFENGGLPATPFATKALMTASALVDGKYAMVTEDAANNGLYVKTAGVWVKSTYDPLSQAKTYTDSTDKKLRLDIGALIDVASLTSHPVWPSDSSGLWLKSSSFTGYILELVTGASYTITGNKTLPTLVYAFNGGLVGATGVTRVADIKTLGLGEVLTVKGTGEYDSLWVSAMDGVQNKKPFEVSYKSNPVVQANTYTDNKVKGVTNNFKTKALMTASALPNDSYAMVTEDTAVNNGLYVKTSGAWVKSGYDPVELANAYTDNKVKGVTNNFKTKALMTASSLPNDSYAMVTEDTEANSGWYSKVGGAWIKSAYVPLVQAKAYTDDNVNELKNDVGLLVNLDGLALYSKYPSASNSTWLGSTKYQGYMFNVTEGESFKITANSNYNAVAYIFNGDISKLTSISGAIDLAKLTEIPIGQYRSITVTGNDNILWVSHNFDTQINKPAELMRLNTYTLKKDVIDNVYASKKNQPSSALTVKELAQNLTSLKSQVTDGFGDKEFKSLGIRGFAGAFTETNNTLFLYRDLAPNVARMTLPLAVGDVLEFNYSPIIGSTLMRHTGAASGHTILGQTFNDNSIVRYYKHIVTNAADYSICNFINGSVKVNGMSVDLSAVTVLQNDSRLQGVAKKGLREIPEWLIYESTSGIKVNRGDIIRIKGVVKGAVAVWANPNLVPPQSAAGWWLAVCSVPDNHPTDTIEWVANESMEVFLQGYVGAEYSIKRSASLKNALLENRKPVEPKSLGVINLPPIETVFATHLSFILKTEMVEGVENIAISQNLGKTWTYIVNTIGKIVNYHFFTDGTILLSSEKECFWTDDYLSFNKSTILRKDGTPWTRQSESSLNFFGQQNGDKPMFVDGQEVYVWGEYAIGSTTVGVWYTTDYGRTIKRAVDFQGENFGGITINARHIHKVYYHAKQETFYVMTGDNGDEIMLVSGKYNLSADTWSWTVIGQGHKYKFGNMWCDDYYAYFTTDYTEAAFKDYWGITRVGLNHLGDPSKFRLAWDAKAGGWGNGSPYRFIADRNGNKVLIGELYTFGYIMVATTGYDFKRVELNESVVLSFILGANDNGDIYMKADLFGRGLGTNAANHLNGGSINITKMLRNAGLVNFMTGEQALPHLSGVSE